MTRRMVKVVRILEEKTFSSHRRLGATLYLLETEEGDRVWRLMRGQGHWIAPSKVAKP